MSNLVLTNEPGETRLQSSITANDRYTMKQMNNSCKLVIFGRVNSPGVFGTDAAGVRRGGRDVRVRNAARFHAQR